jgi:hypothetical protein
MALLQQDTLVSQVLLPPISVGQLWHQETDHLLTLGTWLEPASLTTCLLDQRAQLIHELKLFEQGVELLAHSLTLEQEALVLLTKLEGALQASKPQSVKRYWHKWQVLLNWLETDELSLYRLQHHPGLTKQEQRLLAFNIVPNWLLEQTEQPDLKGLQPILAYWHQQHYQSQQQWQQAHQAQQRLSIQLQNIEAALSTPMS